MTRFDARTTKRGERRAGRWIYSYNHNSGGIAGSRSRSTVDLPFVDEGLALHHGEVLQEVERENRLGAHDAQCACHDLDRPQVVLQLLTHAIYTQNEQHDVPNNVQQPLNW